MANDKNLDGSDAPIDVELLHALERGTSISGVAHLASLANDDGAKLFPVLAKGGRFRRLRLILDTGDEALIMERGPSGDWVGIYTSIYDPPIRMDHCRVVNLIRNISNGED